MHESQTISFYGRAILHAYDTLLHLDLHGKQLTLSRRDVSTTHARLIISRKYPVPKRLGRRLYLDMIQEHITESHTTICPGSSVTHTQMHIVQIFTNQYTLHANSSHLHSTKRLLPPRYLFCWNDQYVVEIMASCFCMAWQITRFGLNRTNKYAPRKCMNKIHKNYEEKFFFFNF